MSDAASTSYMIEKLLWTDADFDRMGWHDAHIHALAFRPEKFQLLFDIDYLFQWVDPSAGETHYRFWLAPCTLTFHNVYQVRISLEPLEDVSVQDVTRSDPEELEQLGTAYLYTIECNEGEVAFRATGYEQLVRRAPVLAPLQRFTEEERGGFSFAAPKDI